MKNKKILFQKAVVFILLLGGFFFISCEKNDDTYFLYPGKTKLDFDYNTNLISFKISNISDDAINWTLSCDDDFLAFSPQYGLIAGGSDANIFISVRRNIITSDSIKSSIHISCNKGKSHNIPVFINNYPEEKIRLSYVVNGAAFDESRQILYLLSTYSGGPKMELYDINEEVFCSYDLSFEYYSSYSDLYIMPDRENGIITSGNMLYQFDTDQGCVIHSQYLNATIQSVTGSNNQDLYITTSDYYGSFSIFNLLTKELSSPQIGNLNDYYVQVHPSWNYVYGIHRYSDFVKIDVRTNPPTIVYTDNQFEGNKMWIVEDGSKIITDEKIVLAIDPELETYDIISSSTIDVSNYSNIIDLAHDAADGLYFMLFENDEYYDKSRSLKKLNESFEVISTLEPEPFLEYSGEDSYVTTNAIVDRVFCNTVNKTLIVVTKSSDENYLATYALEFIDY